jgi:hypothetical protein
MRSMDKDWCKQTPGHSVQGSYEVDGQRLRIFVFESNAEWLVLRKVEGLVLVISNK